VIGDIHHIGHGNARGDAPKIMARLSTRGSFFSRSGVEETLPQAGGRWQPGF